MPSKPACLFFTIAMDMAKFSSAAKNYFFFSTILRLYYYSPTNSLKLNYLTLQTQKFATATLFYLLLSINSKWKFIKAHKKTNTSDKSLPHSNSQHSHLCIFMFLPSKIQTIWTEINTIKWQISTKASLLLANALTRLWNDRYNYSILF